MRCISGADCTGFCSALFAVSPNNSTFYAYDANGDLATKTDRDERVTEYDYDDLGRLIEERWLDATSAVIETIDYTYDLMGRLLTATDDDSSLTYTYDDAGRLLTASNNGVTVPLTVLTSTYDDLGNRETLSANAGGMLDFLNTYVYDALGQMTSVTQQGQTGGRTVADKRVELTYDALGRFDTITRRAGLLATSAVVATTDYTYDNSGRVSGIAHADGSSNSLAEYLYGYDFANRLTSFESDTDSVSYFYDPFGQLRFEDHTSQDDHTYPYDATGNRVAADIETATGNRVVEDVNFTYTYDDEGNLTQKTDKATGDYTLYTWDYHNQLTRVELYDSSDNLTSAVEYKYDALGRRIAKLVDNDGLSGIDETETYVYDDVPGKDGLSDIVLILDGNGDVAHRYLHGPGVDQVFSDENALNEVLWGLADRQGSVRDWIDYDDVTDATTVEDSIDFDAFGNIVSQSNPNHKVFYAYTGRIWDADAGLYDYRARVYDAGIGLMLSEDPSGFDGGDVNLRRYVANGATNFTDASGLEPVF